jgi:hypothetical protein
MLAPSHYFMLGTAIGIGASLLMIIILEGIALWWSLRENKKLQISDIEEKAHENVEKLTDDQLRDQLNNELK